LYKKIVDPMTNAALKAEELEMLQQVSDYSLAGYSIPILNNIEEVI
jgi:hypothetical protein